jgi:predicted Rossmann fold nucleotide-binding protein DprA/Smf involved in DNA uptake
MKIAVVGSRKITKVNLEKYVSEGDEIVSGGAVGVDSYAAEYARKNNLKLTVFLPQYDRYGRGAPIVRNKAIVDYADKVVVFWDGSSKGTLSVIKYAEKIGKMCQVVLCR